MISAVATLVYLIVGMILAFLNWREMSMKGSPREAQIQVVIISVLFGLPITLWLLSKKISTGKWE